MEIIKKERHGSKEWLLARWRDEQGRCVFGASDIPALMGASPYKTRGELFADKSNEPVVQEESAVFRRGNLLEAPLLDNAAMELGIKVITPQVIYRKGRLSISLDGVDDEQKPSIVVEAKTTTRYSIYDSSDLPEEWLWQGWAQQAVTNCPVWFSVLDRDLRMSVVQLPQNPEAISALRIETEVFGGWIDGTSSVNDEILNQFTASDIARIYTVQPDSVDLPSDAAEWLLQLEEGRALQKQGEELETKAKDALARMMLGAEIGLLNGQQVITWKQQAGRRSLDTKRLKEDHPELCAEYEREGAPFRVMKTTKAKKESR
jgi:predicted phage-related endonuclease